MSGNRGKIAFAVVAALLAALFLRLGVWQLDRHRERRDANETRAARLARPPLEISSETPAESLPGPDSLAWRRVRLRGRWDFPNEFLIGPRSHEGRPAVELLTPLLLSDGRAVLVLRGWLPAPDGLHAPIRRGRSDTDLADLEGVALPYPADRRTDGRRIPATGSTPPAPVLVDGEPHVALRAPDLEIASDVLSYTITPFYVIASRHVAPQGDLRLLSRPKPGSGPHLAYALQWFAFALITIGGTIAFLRSG